MDTTVEEEADTSTTTTTSTTVCFTLILLMRLRFDFILFLYLNLKTSVDAKNIKPSKLDKETQDLISLIFDKDMFKEALKKFDIGIDELCSFKFMS